MTSLAPTASAISVASPPSSDRGRSIRARLLVTATALAGAGLTGYGVAQPWLSTFAGMITQSGWGTSNGSRMLMLSAAAVVTAVLQAARPSLALRWVVAVTGLAIAGFAGYLLIQVYGVTAQMDGMVLAAKGPGLYFAVAGGALVFATIFFPLPNPSVSQGSASVTAAAHRVQSEASVLRPLRSRLRYPAAALAIIAGLAHVPVTPQHLQEAPYIGVLFIVFTVTAVLTGTALLISDAAPVWLLLGGSCALAVAAYVLSRTVGLPLMTDDVNNWLDPWGVLSVVAESGAAVLTAVVLARRR